MSQVPVPPRGSSKSFNEKLARRNEADRIRNEAQKSADSLEDEKSAEYWTFRKREAEASLVINEIDAEIAEKGTEAERRRKDSKGKAWLEGDKKRAEQKIRRYEARSRVVETAKIANPNLVAMRASYLELLMSLWSKNSLSSRSSEGDFMYDLRANYGAKKIARDHHVWCPMLGKWVLKCTVEAAHLFPFSLGQQTMTYIFGDDADGEMNKASNGLFLYGHIHEKFNRHWITIVPCETETEKPQEYKFLVLDQDIWNHELDDLGKGCTYADLHERKLIFESKHSYRPSARYLYFHYLMAMLRIAHGQRAKKAGTTSLWAEVTKMTPGASRAWVTAAPGRYLREPILRAFIEGINIGHFDDEETTDNPEAANDMLSHAVTSADLPPDETANMLETATQIPMESEDDDSSDDGWQAFPK
ncbi:hypothetical protein MMC07_004635 [Pseudocyphellaria aurata]|nr:hypothetical protein [Pseudocyphellaria aurata]